MMLKFPDLFAAKSPHAGKCSISKGVWLPQPFSAHFAEMSVAETTIGTGSDRKRSKALLLPSFSDEQTWNVSFGHGAGIPSDLTTLNLLTSDTYVGME